MKFRTRFVAAILAIVLATGPLGLTQVQVADQEIAWDAPLAGRPTGYEIQYRKVGDPNWTDHPHTDLSTSTFITMELYEDYDIRVRPYNDTEVAPWVTIRKSAALFTVGLNFSTGPTSYLAGTRSGSVSVTGTGSWNLSISGATLLGTTSGTGNANFSVGFVQNHTSTPRTITLTLTTTRGDVITRQVTQVGA
ncbi:MAG: fibronectin type III domain-containing protein, partial [Caldilineaceae bacterium SB0668_bin_21]|nr:fibronectin type III domain-containing protein [Caldilineaceae bacterium SB0668_bin_21]